MNGKANTSNSARIFNDADRLVIDFISNDNQHYYFYINRTSVGAKMAIVNSNWANVWTIN